MQLPSLGKQGQPAGGLDILGITLPDQQRTAPIGLQIVGVLSDAADQQQRPPVGIQAIGHDGTEREARHLFGVGGQHATVFLEQQFSGMLRGLALISTPR